MNSPYTVIRHDAGLRRVESLIHDYWADLRYARVYRPRTEATAIESALRDLIDVRRALQGRAK